MLSERMPIEQRHQLWSDLCLLADQLLELTQLWWRIDHELAAVHDQRCGAEPDQVELPFHPAATDDLDF